MSDKLNFSPESLTRLESYSLLVLEGPDAVAFIQAQSMNDVKSLVDGQWHWNGLLNPKGRLIALFALVRIRADLLYLLSPDFAAVKIAAHLQRFIFRSKVKLVIHNDKTFAAEFNPVATSAKGRDFVIGSPELGFSLDFSSDSCRRKLWVLPAGVAQNLVHDNAAESCWRDQDIRHGLPRLLESQSEQWTPQMLSLEHLKAFSLKKGCYPGQEIVARTHYLGQAKRHSVPVQSLHLAVGDVLTHNGEKVGELICVNSTNDSGLALLQSVADSLDLVCRENDVRHLQALTGLERPA